MSDTHGSSDSQNNQYDPRAIYDDVSPMLYGYLVRKVGPELAGDILQESFLRLLQVLDTRRKIDNPKSYLFQIARNLIAKEFSRNNMNGNADFPGILTDKKADTEADLYKKELLGLLESARQTLGQSELEIFELRWFQGFTQTEIAEIINKSERQVRRDLEKIIRKLKDFFKNAGWYDEDTGLVE